MLSEKRKREIIEEEQLRMKIRQGKIEEDKLPKPISINGGNIKKSCLNIFVGTAIGVVILLIFIRYIGTATRDNSSTANKNSTAQTESLPAYREAASYKKSSDTWKMIVFSKKPSENELKAVAIELHKQDTNSKFHLFDDDTKIEEFKNWDINYGKVFDKDGVAKQASECDNINYCTNLVKSGNYAYKLPEDWANQHELGIINQMLSDSGMKWQLSTPLDEKIADL